jgi:hypothetical protein
MVRAWLRRAEGVYDLHEQWDQIPVVDQIGRHVRDEARFDTLTPWAWDFEGDYGLEGWTACAEHPVRVEEGALVFATVGCADSPDWTAIDTDLFDQVVLQVRTDTAGEAELFWGQSPDSPTGGARFATLAGEQTIVLPVGLLTSWDSAIRWLRLRPGVGPAATRVGTTDLAALWVQHSATHLSTGPGFSSLQPVALLSGPELNPAADVGPSPAAEDDPDDQAPIRSSTLESSTGCATVSPVSPAWWLVVGFASLALRRRNRVASDF